ncbi:TetR/AcrR family transcriptional regulator C-terminal domain-containing protein [Novosphingobium album (ex Hu et al. 2023)]|uniref:TetR/AcrR family transcriptional regulator C-terminal domain-containing protein n=1 Tax=Novosphingobium album (ex Hu et al. 2023) TaxID=2930093 RepID=A0ABT0AZ04_9SPHN|nr:TetR/AcrR family transcriptional regulator C-terminal domain-containing protein [Novosphingobium album (ex Hu et al. 2023)]MCJ2177888.1 TetR/AcrR family transcriptional regulator C-terminal domain-containing protein [Novosphingobium album (ex Hu et al. 2023)]
MTGHPLMAAPVRAGRPTREQARARQAALLDCALEHFLDKGYEAATIEAIAAEMNMTKRTVYARYPEKAALFRAAVRRGTELRAPAQDVIEATRSGDLEATLIAIALLRIRLVSTPEGTKLQRLISTESYRFPEIFQTDYNIAVLPTVRFLADILAQETAKGELAIDDAMAAANVFLSMVVSGPVRFILSGHELAPDDIDHRVGFAVRLFLNGARPR